MTGSPAAPKSQLAITPSKLKSILKEHGLLYSKRYCQLLAWTPNIGSTSVLKLNQLAHSTYETITIEQVDACLTERRKNQLKQRHIQDNHRSSRTSLACSPLHSNSSDVASYTSFASLSSSPSPAKISKKNRVIDKIYEAFTSTSSSPHSPPPSRSASAAATIDNNEHSYVSLSDEISKSPVTPPAQKC